MSDFLELFAHIVPLMTAFTLHMVHYWKEETNRKEEEKTTAIDFGNL